MNIRPLTAAFGTELTALAEIDPAGIRQLVRDSGAVLVRSKATVESFVELTNRLIKGFHQYQGGAFERDAITGFDNLMTTTSAKDPFPVPLHGECYYMRQRPGSIWFYCKKPSANGDGMTLLCDGVQLLRELDEKTRAFFEENELTYVRLLPKQAWKGAFGTEKVEEVLACLKMVGQDAAANADQTAILSRFRTSALSPTQFTNDPAFINTVIPAILAEEMMKLLLEGPVTSGTPDHLASWMPPDEKAKLALQETFRQMRATGRNAGVIVRLNNNERLPEEIVRDVLRTAARLTYEIHWAEGDFLGVDNSRVMHGRGYCSDSSRSVLCRMGDFA